MMKFVKNETAKVFNSSSSNKSILELLWGDSVEVLDNNEINGRIKVNARWAKNKFINADELCDKPLLELYFIDVGQGDGILLVTPDRKRILIDGGYTRTKQPHGNSLRILSIGNFLLS